MRLIHTADWHIGHSLVGHARDHEHRTVLAGLAGIVAARQPDALIVAGDVFDHQNPSGEAQRLLYDTLVALRRAQPRMTIVVTAGNHDAAGRLEAPHPLLRAMNVHVVGSVQRANGRVDGRRHLVPVAGASGDVEAHVLAVSYPTAACLPPWRGDDDRPADRQVRALYEELLDASGAGRGGVPLIVTGHLHVAGGLESEGAERRILVGGQHAVGPDALPAGAAYVALGHLHKAQAVGRATVRYCGSLLPLSASEIGYQHGVTEVTIEGGAATSVEHIPLERPVAFHRLPERGEMRADEIGDRLAALDLDPGLPVELQPFVQVWLSREGLAAGYRAQIDEVAERFPVRLLDPRVARPEGLSVADLLSEPHLRLAELDPEDLFRRAFERAHGGSAPTEAHVEAFRIAAEAAARGEA